jgi:Putative auto-transporter adhesin, head GIN domain
MRPTVILLPTLLCGIGCSMGSTDCVKGTGDVVTREIPVAMLNAIVVEGSTDVTVVRGDTQRVEITGQPQLIDLLKTKVDNGVWEITTTKCYSSDRDLSVRLTLPMLNSVIIEGSGDVTSEQVFNTGKTHLAIKGSGSIAIDTLHEGLLEVVIEGSGSVSVHGTCRELECTSNGSGDLHALGLAANEAELDLKGSGSVELTAISELDAELTGSGSLRYKGKPEVSTKVTGSGSVTALP